MLRSHAVMVAVLASMLSSFTVADDSCSSLPVPKYAHGNAVVLSEGGTSASATLEVYWDLLCPDSRDQSKQVVDVIDHYGLKDLTVIIHPYPLPYHRNGFMASWASYIVRSLRPDDADKAQWAFIREAFDKQEALYNVNAEDVTWSQAQKLLAGWAAASTNVSTTAFLSRFVCNFKTCDDSYSLTNVAFKYGAAHGAAATPTTLVNGQEIVTDTSSWSLNEWQQLLDPVVFPNRRT